MTIAAGISGLAPTVQIQPTNPERAKYEKLWGQHAEYREVSPGENWAMTFLKQARPEKDAEVIDFGCGTGRGALALALFGAMKVRMVDFAGNCLDEDVSNACASQPTRLSFQVADLTKTLPMHASYGYCVDVMEHIPTDDVPKVLRNILASAQHCFFGISTVQDKCGALIGEQLHLTVKPMAWWIEQLTEIGAVVHWSHEAEEACAIYCSAWRDAAEVLPKDGRINADREVVEAQTIANIRAGWAHVTPHDVQDREVILLAGGPSMNDEVDHIRRLREEGAALITVNGAYHWALDHGLTPSAQIVLDAREFNSRFTRPLVDTCRYLIASQVHPATLEGLPRERTLLWHSGVSEAAEAMTREVNGGHFFPVPGGSTVVLRAIPLLRMLGLKRIHLFGFDSCCRSNSQHHAYAQVENDGELVVPVSIGGRSFECTGWQVAQASEFRELVRLLGDEVELAVHGDGLIAHVLKTGADIAALEAAKYAAPSQVSHMPVEGG